MTTLSGNMKITGSFITAMLAREGWERKPEQSRQGTNEKQ